MKIVVLGLRGVPGIQGGVETHAENLYPLLVELGCDVEILTRSPFIDKEHPKVWKGIRLRRLWCPSVGGIEAFVHSLIGVVVTAFLRPDILHIHAIGPAIMTPLARLLGIRVIVTHHGPDYDREKWGSFASWILRTGERLGMRFSNQRIVISDVIRKLVLDKYHKESILIYNGVNLPVPLETGDTLEKFGLDPSKYILQVSRLVPEKRQSDLIQAFEKKRLEGWKLVLVGKLDKNDPYCRELISLAGDNRNIIFTGFQTGNDLQCLYANAGLFVLPSSHEGLPIALLEALSFGLRVLASDIPANLEIALPADQYFKLGDIEQLAKKLEFFAGHPLTQEDQSSILEWIRNKYDWKIIARKTLDVYSNTIR